MRYREGEEFLAHTGVHEGMLLATVIIGLLMGIGFVIAGRRGRQYWLAIWGGGLVVASVAYLVYVGFIAGEG